MLGSIFHHLHFVDDGPFAEIIDAADVAWQQAESLEAAAIKRTVLVKEWYRRTELLVLYRNKLVARGGIQARRPHIGIGRTIGVVAKFL
jgi:hypothetical protein